MNHLLLIPIFYIIFVTTIICLIHTFVPDYPMNRINIFSPYKKNLGAAVEQAAVSSRWCAYSSESRR